MRVPIDRLRSLVVAPWRRHARGKAGIHAPPRDGRGPPDRPSRRRARTNRGAGQLPDVAARRERHGQLRSPAEASGRIVYKEPPPSPKTPTVKMAQAQPAGGMIMMAARRSSCSPLGPWPPRAGSGVRHGLRRGLSAACRRPRARRPCPPGAGRSTCAPATSSRPRSRRSTRTGVTFRTVTSQRARSCRTTRSRPSSWPPRTRSSRSA